MAGTMKRMHLLFGTSLICLLCLLPVSLFAAHEKVLASYFDILVDSPEGTEVTGRIHLERNKDVHTMPVPEGYHFEILRQPEEALFRIETRYDLSKRMMGVLAVDKGKSTPSAPRNYRMIVALKDGDRQLEKFDVNVRIVRQTLWSLLYERYLPKTLRNPRMYGNKKCTDAEIGAMIEEVERNGGKFEGFRSYGTKPQDFDGRNTIEHDWTSIASKIGQMGYAYAASEVYGPEGRTDKRERLKNALYKAILAYTRSVPVEGDDVMIDGKPIGDCTGDGFSLLEADGIIGRQVPTHQWTMTDPLVVPALHLMPGLLEGMKKGDETCLQVHDALVRYFQIFMSVIKSRRAIDNPDERWGEIRDTLYSSGAWADANLWHRSRTMLALPLIWADYNRPMTYVQYWYEDFYGGKPFEGFSFQPGWSPHGVVSDVSYWMTKYNIPAHRYAQSGFQPDGTISHHVGHGTDAAMVAYGFEWLTDCSEGYAYFKDTPFKIADKHYQFQLDRLLEVYPKLFYKQRMDFLVAGRSFLHDMRRFVLKTYPNAVRSLFRARSRDTRLERAEELEEVCRRLKENTYEHSGTHAYWVNEFLVHRRGENEPSFYASLKLKSERTVGAEDFDRKVRHSWHMGYGILPVKVDGDEYSDKVLKNFDWHALPGLTEEWRTDPFPLEGGSQASLPGRNKIAGVLADGVAGMGIYRHLPAEGYSSASAFKTYHFIGGKIISMASGIAREREGRHEDIVTFIDQSDLRGTLTWYADGERHEIAPDESVNIAEPVEGVCWLHQGKKGYVLLPEGKLQLLIKTGKEINATDPREAGGKPNFIIAIGHGAVPGEEWSDACRYIQLPNVSAEGMAEKVEALLGSLELVQKPKSAHAAYSADEKTWQYAFFRPDEIEAGGVKVVSDDVAEIMLRDTGDGWVLSVGNPMPDGKKQTLSFTLSLALKPGVYAYPVPGMNPYEGETVTVASEGARSRVTVELPDIRDAARYGCQSDLYSAVPVVVRIPKAF